VNSIDALIGKVGRQGFDQDARSLLLDFRYGRGDMSGAAVGKIVSIDTGKDDIT
jgi:hypothetical protein